jgi:hypothetical protein
MNLILLVVVLLLIVGALPTWPYSSGWGYYPSAGADTPVRQKRFSGAIMRIRGSGCGGRRRHR